MSLILGISGGISQTTLTTTINNAINSNTLVTAATGMGVTIVPGGLPTTTTAPVQPDNRGASNWTSTIAGSGASFTNAADQTLGYNGFRLRSAPAAQNLARLHYSASLPGVTSAIAGLLSGVLLQGRVTMTCHIDVIDDGTTDAFHCHVGICSNYSSTGGFLAAYCSDVSSNWQLAFLSNTSSYNFPFPVPQRLVDSGVLAVNGGIHLLKLTITSELATLTIDGTDVAQIDFSATPLSANEFVVVSGSTPVQQHPQLAVSKEAGNDTVDLWVPDGIVSFYYDPVAV